MFNSPPLRTHYGYVLLRNAAYICPYVSLFLIDILWIGFVKKCGTGKMCGHYISRLGVAALQLLAELTISQSLYVALCLKLLLKLTTSQFLLLHIKDIRLGFTSMMFAFPLLIKLVVFYRFLCYNYNGTNKIFHFWKKYGR